MKILITGCYGLIGSSLVNWLLKSTEHDVIGVDNSSGGFWENIEPGNPFPDSVIFEGDVCDKQKINEIFSLTKPDIVYHAAAYAAENLSPFIRCFNYTNNLVGTSAIVNACIEHDVKRLVFFSSIAVYGHGNPPYEEHQTPTPNDPYAIAKYACELDIKVAGEQHGLDWCIVRPFNVYGINQNIKDKFRNVLGIWMNQYLSGKPLTIFGDGEQVRSFTYVEDIMQPLYNAGTKNGASKQIFNLGSGAGFKISFAAQKLIQIMGGGTIEYLPPRHEVKVAYADTSKGRGVLEYEDTTPFEVGLRKMWLWAKGVKREEKPAPEYEITKGIYDTWKK